MKSKKIVLIGAFAILSFSAASQEAIMPGANKVVSPQLNPDSTVTLRIFAPAAKSVGLAGNLVNVWHENQVNKDSINPYYLPLTGKDGLWEVTLGNLPADLYSYSFVVDGVPTLDPVNVYNVRDVKSVSNLFILPGEKSERYEVKRVPHGTVSHPWYHSGFADNDRRLTVYTPAGYESNPDRRYPVLYLLHGMGGDETAWSELGRAAQILDNMIAAGEVAPMIVVMPNGNVARDAAPGESPLGYEVPEFHLPYTMDGNYEYLFPEIVNFIDTNFRTIPEKEKRAIAGLSMGGHHSMAISYTYPDLFDYVGLFSAVTHFESSSSAKGRAVPGFYDNQLDKLKNQFGKGLKLYWIGMGEKDFLYEDGKRFRAELDSIGAPYTYRESGGGHEWRNWRRYLVEFLPKLFKTTSAN